MILKQCAKIAVIETEILVKKMKFTIERANLLKSLSHVQSIVEKRNTIPVLSNVRIEAMEDGISFTGKQDNAVDFYAMYGGFLFLGVFLGGLFLLATVLIMYYKQISEGYEDQRRYQIMRQVGMTEREVQGSIHSQILLVFFLPLGAAAIHSLAAFPMLSRMLRLFQINNVGLFAACCGGTILVFCVIYALVFLLTARTYGRIVGTSERR